MIGRILRELRWVTVVAVIASLLGALLMLYVGASGTVEAINSYLRLAEEPGPGLKFTALIRVIESLDAFLVALALLIFSMGVFTLFIQDPGETQIAPLPDSLRPKTLGDLKQTLAEIILLVLLVLYLDEVLRAADRSDWELLIGLPAGIALLAAAVRLVDLRHKE